MTTKKWSEVKADKGGRPTYWVLAERDGKFWFLRVLSRPELFTQTLRLDQAEAMVRDLVATWDEVDPDSFDVRLRIRIDPQVDDATEAVRHVRLIQALGSNLTRTLAAHLVREKGLSLRDAGRVLELAHQRVAQLLEEHDAMGGDARGDLAAAVDAIDMWSQRKASVTIQPGDGPEKIERARELVDKGLTSPGGRVQH